MDILNPSMQADTYSICAPTFVNHLCELFSNLPTVLNNSNCITSFMS